MTKAYSATFGSERCVCKSNLDTLDGFGTEFPIEKDWCVGVRQNLASGRSEGWVMKLMEMGGTGEVAKSLQERTQITLELTTNVSVV